MSKLQKIILEKIKKRHLKPRAKWSFALKDYAVWGSAGIAIFIGALASAVIIFMLRDNDWELLPYMNNHGLSYVFASLPYFWLLSVIVLAAIALYYFKHTKKGYRYSILLIIVITIGSSAVLGAVFHSIGWGQAIDRELLGKVPLYRDHLDARRRIWSQADGSLLAGTIITLENGKVLTLRAIDGQEWRVKYSTARVIAPRELEENMAVKIIGERQAEMIMQAALIKAMLGSGPPWLMPLCGSSPHRGCMMNIAN